MSTGEYLTVLSGDDFWCDNLKWHKQVEFLEKSKRYASCYTDFKYYWSDDREELRYTYDNLSRAELWSHYYVHISCFVFKREALRNLLDRFCDDTGLIFSILKAGKAKHIKDISFAYRQRGGSIMHEAKRLELNVLEVALFQDIRNASGYTASSYAKYALPLLYVYRHRDELRQEPFVKYLDVCDGYPNDFLNNIYVGKCSCKLYMTMGMGISSLFFFALMNRVRRAINFLRENRE